ncbi:MAG: helix-turn-helix domain-containing protein [Alphaproteobacteria bacterium]|nr:helix-turn-helix domain-containing protein [Alphaproteobacteria bacterium]MBQ8631410.1 helix-turn-helix domain-containing protein [Alphaproteobacteria bacterium]
MYTEFGKWLRTLRISIGIRLYDMSKALSVSSSFISAVETGKKSIPLDFVEKIIKNYDLSDEQIAALKNAVKLTRDDELRCKKSIQLKVDTSKSDVQELLYCFARKADELTEEEKKAMWDILNSGV